MTHLIRSYPSGSDKPAGVDNHRNGVSGKMVLTDDGPLRIDVPRDWVGRFAPVLIPKHERCSAVSTTGSLPCTRSG